MSATVQYKGSTIATIENTTKTLQTEGKYMEADVVITDVSSGGGGSKFKSGIYAEDGYIYISPDPGAGGILQGGNYIFLSKR